MLQRFFRCLSISILLGYVSATSAQPFQFTNFFFFGDSLTDSGNILGYRATNGAVWAELLTQRYGQTLKPYYTQGGNNFAVVTATTKSTLFQIETLLEKLEFYDQPFDSNALYSIWAGPNDFEPCKSLTGDAATTCFTNAATGVINNLSSAVNMLGGAGANYILLLNVVNFANTPEYATNPNSARIASGISTLNIGIAQAINQTGYNVIQVDVRSLFDAVIANPTKYGLTNVTTPCQNTPSLCNTYLFWDTLHPSSAGHELVQYMVSSYFEGPLYAAMLGEAPFGTLHAYHMALGDQLSGVRTGKIGLRVGHLRPFTNVNYSINREDGTSFDPGIGIDPIMAPLGFKSTSTNMVVGAEYRLQERILVGVAMGYANNQVRFAQSGGGVTAATNFFSAFAGYLFERGYIQAMLSAGLINFNNFTRNIRLRKTIDIFDTAIATAKGSQVGGKIEGGYRLFERGGFQTGPVANTEYQAVRVNPFGEQGATPGFNLQYTAQNTTSLVTGIGWQISHAMRMNNVEMRPYVQATYNREWLRNDRQMGASAISLGANPYYIPTPSATGFNGRNWGLIDLGISARLRRGIVVSLAYQTTVGLQRGEASMVMASVAIPI